MILLITTFIMHLLECSAFSRPGSNKKKLSVCQIKEVEVMMNKFTNFEEHLQRNFVYESDSATPRQWKIWL